MCGGGSFSSSSLSSIGSTPDADFLGQFRPMGAKESERIEIVKNPLRPWRPLREDVFRLDSCFPLFLIKIRSGLLTVAALGEC
jgi:hypothetical protein